MFRKLATNRDLNFAILISLSWHIICVFLISPILLPNSAKRNVTSISFLGAILENVIASPEKIFDPDKVSFMDKLQTFRDTDIAAVNLEASLVEQPDPYLKINKEEFKTSGKKSNIVPRYYPESKRKRPRVSFKETLITGGAKDRAVLYEPTLPERPLVSFGLSSKSIVSIKFMVSPHGFVEMPELVLSSGQTDIDSIALRHVRRWQFVPDYNYRSESQEAVMKIVFN